MSLKRSAALVTLGAVVAAVAVRLGMEGSRAASPWLYRQTYYALGPWGATKAASSAVLVAAALAGCCAVVAAAVLVDRQSDRPVPKRRLGVLVGGQFGAVVLAVAGVSLFDNSFVVFALIVPLAVGTVYLVLRWRSDGRSTDGLTVAVGATPVFLWLLLATGTISFFWAPHSVVAAESNASAEGAVAMPDRVERDLFGDCDPAWETEGCQLSLHGYDHEETAVRFLADNGVRCPYRGHTTDDAVRVTHNGTVYGV